MPRSILRKKQRERKSPRLSFSQGDTGVGELDNVPGSSDPAQLEEEDTPEKQSNESDEVATVPLLQRLHQKSLRSAGPAPRASPPQVTLARLGCAVRPQRIPAHIQQEEASLDFWPHSLQFLSPVKG
jgi:hypothetical protein